MGKVDEQKHPVNKRVPQSYKSIEAPPLKGVQNVLEENLCYQCVSLLAACIKLQEKPEE
jgi:hypothetical protein